VTDWWLDEGSTAGREHLDREFVDGYDAKAQYDPAEDVTALRHGGLGPGTTLIDFGAGTGALAAAAAATGARVVAVDVSSAMVDEMRRRRAADAAPVEIVEAGVLSYIHHGPPVDFVFSRNTLHQLPDFWKVIALRRVAEVLRPGGILRLRDLCFDVEPSAIEETIDAWMEFAAADPSLGYTSDEFADHIRGEYSTFTWLLEPMLERAGFEIVDREVRLGIYAAYTCRRRGGSAR
jgi:SAM-dependent methyltransferase